jgi:predicted DNA-binding protein
MEQNKTERLVLRITKQDKNRLIQLAQKKGETLSRYIRNLINN